MNCLECRELLQCRLDGEHLSASLALDQHLAGCQSCRHTHAAGMLMLEGLKALPRSPELPADFARRMAARIVHDRQHRRAHMRRRVWVTAGLAAAVLIIVWAGNVWLPQPNLPKAPAPGIVQKNKQLTEPVPPNKPSEENVTPLAKSVDEARNDVLALTTRLAKDQARLFAAIVPPEMPAFPGDPGHPMEEPLEPATDSLRQAGQGVSEGLTAVSRNARRAVVFFMKELPVLDSTN